MKVLLLGVMIWSWQGEIRNFVVDDIVNFLLMFYWSRCCKSSKNTLIWQSSDLTHMICSYWRQTLQWSGFSLVSLVSSKPLIGWKSEAAPLSAVQQICLAKVLALSEHKLDKNLDSMLWKLNIYCKLSWNSFGWLKYSSKLMKSPS